MIPLTQDRIADIVKRYRPAGYAVLESRRRSKTLTGLTDFRAKTIHVPRLVGAASLYTFFHEVGHVVLGHSRTGRDRPAHLEEYEAEMFAHFAMQLEQIPVSRTVNKTAKRHVRTHWKADFRRGPVTLDPRVNDWAWTVT